MEPTKLLYLENFDLINCTSKVADVLEEDGRTFIVLDQTCFYPQGGGQPYDKGVIENPSGKFNVEEVRFVDGIVRHIGSFASEKFNKGDEVNCLVDQARRELNSKIHSGGHLVDMGVNQWNLGWIPGKGFHFPDGPYVEYAGSLEGVDVEKLKTDLEDTCNKLLIQNIKVTSRFMDKEEMKTVCKFVPDYIPEDKPLRVVLFGEFGVPCGGTHVNNLSEIGRLTIRKIKSEGENIRVGYDVSR